MKSVVSAKLLRINEELERLKTDGKTALAELFSQSRDRFLRMVGTTPWMRWTKPTARYSHCVISNIWEMHKSPRHLV